MCRCGPASGALVILDCGTGARNLDLTLLGQGFGEGNGEAAILLSHAHWDHIQGFPFFGPLYVAGNCFTCTARRQSSGMLEGMLEGQMAPQFFPVQTLTNMGAHIEIARSCPSDREFDVFGCQGHRPC